MFTTVVLSLEKPQKSVWKATKVDLLFEEIDEQFLQGLLPSLLKILATPLVAHAASRM